MEAATKQQVRKFLEILRNSSDPVAEGVLDSLIRIGEPAILPLIEALAEENYSVRYYAVLTLNKIGDQRAILPLYKLLSEKDRDLREAAAFALADLDKLNSQTLIEDLKSKDWCLRSSALIILGKLKDTQAIEPILSCLEDENSEVRSRAAFALGEIGDTAFTTALIKTTEDEIIIVRASAVDALSKIGTKTVLPVLQNLAENDPVEFVRDQAWRAIWNINARE
jgi:HEAT repeat protein